MIAWNVFILSIYLCTVGPLTTTFQELEQIDNHQDIVIRGFLYQTADDRWILAGEPNLRSCCVGARHTAKSQLQLQGTFDRQKINQVIAVRGTLQRHDKLYLLMDAMELPSKSSWKLILFFVLGILILFLFTKFALKN